MLFAPFTKRLIVVMALTLLLTNIATADNQAWTNRQDWKYWNLHLYDLSEPLSIRRVQILNQEPSTIYQEQFSYGEREWRLPNESKIDEVLREACDFATTASNSNSPLPKSVTITAQHNGIYETGVSLTYEINDQTCNRYK